MKSFALAIVLSVCALAGAALEVDGNKLIMSPAEVAMCAQGCTLVTNRQLDEVRKAVILMIQEIESRPKTCKRGDFT